MPSTIGVGFGTAALGDSCYDVVVMALDAGFRKFDTAEADWWYDQKAVGSALKSFFLEQFDDECISGEQYSCSRTCHSEDLQISTKIPPWSLTSDADIRAHAADSRDELVGFCEPTTTEDEDGNVVETTKYPLDVYYIHAPNCWAGWHPRCDNVGETLPLREAWMAMEAVVGVDRSAKRIGLSNVHPPELLDIIRFVRERQASGDTNPPPRMPDVLQAFADPLSPATELRRICEEHDIEFVSYSTLGTQHHNQPGNPVLGSAKVKDTAAKYERSTAEVVLSWALQRGMSVIPRSSKKHHIRELANMLTMPPFLSEEDLLVIDSLELN